MKHILLIFALLLASHHHTGAAEIKAAAAKTIITPQETMYLSGFANREVPAEGTAMELFARALAIEDANGTRLVIVTLDLVEVPHQLRDAVAAVLKAKFALPEKSLLMNCSDTHCGPELRYTELEFMGLADTLEERIIAKVREMWR